MSIVCTKNGTTPGMVIHQCDVCFHYDNLIDSIICSFECDEDLLCMFILENFTSQLEIASAGVQTSPLHTGNFEWNFNINL